MNFILLGFLLFRWFANAKYCPCLTTSCINSAECRSASVSHTPQFSPYFQSVAPLLDSRYLPIGRLEACNIDNYCRSHPPGDYCYVPSSNVTGGNCDCLPAAFIQCPFGIVNVCKRGFGCMNDFDSSGVMTASCTHFQTLTTMSILTSINVLFSTVLTSTGVGNYSTSIQSILTNNGTIKSIQTQAFLSSTKTYGTYSTGIVIATSISVRGPTSRNYTFTTIAPIYITATSCNGTIVGNASTVYAKNPGPLAIFQPLLCAPLLPDNAGYNPRTTRIIKQCPIIY